LEHGGQAVLLLCDISQKTLFLFMTAVGLILGSTFAEKEKEKKQIIIMPVGGRDFAAKNLIPSRL
jgi:hypothetical protein